jgi:antitoxin CcdA
MSRASRAAEAGRPSPGPKAPTNVTVRVDLVKRARALGINLSELLETALEATLRERERATWVDENADAIDDYNAVVGKRGVFGDAWRRF